MSVCRARAMPNTNPRPAPSPQHHPAPRLGPPNAQLHSCTCLNNLRSTCIYPANPFKHLASHPRLAKCKIPSSCASHAFGFTTRTRMQLADIHQPPTCPRLTGQRVHHPSFCRQALAFYLLTCLHATLVGIDNTPSPSRPACPQGLQHSSNHCTWTLCWTPGCLLFV
jgi:hypothetical protein